MGDRHQRWLEFLLAERLRRTEYRATHRNALEWLEAELDAMYERLAQSVADGNFWSPDGDVSMAERVAMFGRWPPGCEVDLEREAAAIETWFSEHGYTC